jgi:hypothetical protein
LPVRPSVKRKVILKGAPARGAIKPSSFKGPVYDYLQAQVRGKPSIGFTKVSKYLRISPRDMKEAIERRRMDKELYTFIDELRRLELRAKREGLSDKVFDGFVSDRFFEGKKRPSRRH